MASQRVQLFIGNVPGDCSQQELADVFNVNASNVYKKDSGGGGRTFGFVTVASMQEAEKCINMLNGAAPLNLQVALSKNSRQAMQGGGGRRNNEQGGSRDAQNSHRQNGHGWGPNNHSSDESGEQISRLHQGRRSMPSNDIPLMPTDSKQQQISTERGEQISRLHQGRRSMPSNDIPLMPTDSKQQQISTERGEQISRLHQGKRSMPSNDIPVVPIDNKQQQISTEVQEEVLCANCQEPATGCCQVCEETYCGTPCQISHWPIHKVTCLENPPPFVIKRNLRKTLSITLNCSPSNISSKQSSVDEKTMECPEIPQALVIGKQHLPKDKFSEVGVIMCADRRYNMYWVQLTNKVMDLMKLNREIQSSVSSSKILKPKVGVYCIGYFEECWYRGQITSLDPLKVFYIDFGNEETVIDGSKLRELPQFASELKAQALKIKIEKSELFETGTVLSVKAEDEGRDGSIIVMLESCSDSKVKSPPANNCRNSINRRQVNVNDSPAKCIERESLPIGVCMSVRVLDAYKPGEAWVQLSANIKDIFELTQRLDSDSSNMLEELDKGLYCMGMFEGDWYRAKITQIEPLKVFFVDFGNEANVKPQELRVLPDFAWEMKAQAMQIKFNPYKRFKEGAQLKVRCNCVAASTCVVEIVESGGSSCETTEICSSQFA